MCIRDRSGSGNLPAFGVSLRGWDLLGMVLLFYDLITVPLQFFGDKYVNMNSNALLGAPRA
eukprot:37330-Amphidinium_carterae.1